MCGKNGRMGTMEVTVPTPDAAVSSRKLVSGVELCGSGVFVTPNPDPADMEVPCLSMPTASCDSVDVFGY